MNGHGPPGKVEGAARPDDAPNATPTTQAQAKNLKSRSRIATGSDLERRRAALDLAAQGVAVLPCNPAPGPNAKAPLLKHGHHDASRDPAVITEWWTRRPDAMIGAVLPPTLVVLDVDPRNGGSIDALQAALGPLPPTLTCISGRGDGGFHAYYRRPTGDLSSARLPDGVDLKKSGYLIVPPSVHPDSGKPYRWVTRPVVELPEAAVQALRPAPVRQLANALASSPGAVDGLIRAVADAPEGRRNGRLFWAACRVLEEGHPADVLAELGAVAEAIGLDPREVTRTLQSAERRVTA